MPGPTSAFQELLSLNLTKKVLHSPLSQLWIPCVDAQPHFALILEGEPEEPIGEHPAAGEVGAGGRPLQRRPDGLDGEQPGEAGLAKSRRDDRWDGLLHREGE